MNGNARAREQGSGTEVYKSPDGTELAVIAATWEVRKTVTFESLSPEFKRNSAQAWRNYGSRVTGAMVNLAIKDPEQVLHHVNTTRSDPFDYAKDKVREWLRGKRGTRYFIHFDLAKNKDKAGLAMVHREPTGVVVVDLMHAIAPLPGKNIDFAALRDFVYLFQERGCAIELVTYDQWQSEDSRQILESKGFKTDYVSADKTTAPYDTAIEMLTTGRLDYYNHPIFLREMRALRTNGLKYDHPKKGSKDVADAVACATWACINYELENPKEAPGKIKVVRSGRAARRFKPQYEKSVW